MNMRDTDSNLNTNRQHNANKQQKKRCPFIETETKSEQASERWVEMRFVISSVVASKFTIVVCMSFRWLFFFLLTILALKWVWARFKIELINRIYERNTYSYS